MNARMRMDEPDHRHRLDDMAQGVIGRPLDRPEGPLKVSGRATYAHEWQVPGMVHGALVRAPVAHGRLKGMDADSVRALPGVLAVLSGHRFLRNPAQGTANKAPVQGASEIFYYGQPVALVVAETLEQARHGADSLKLDIEPLEAAVLPEAVPPETPPKKQLDQGDLDAAIRNAAFVVDQVYRTPPHSSAPMEPHAAIAEWDGDDLLVRASYQMLKYNRNELADSLGIDPKHVRILSPYVGGGFGSKLGISHEAVSAALAAKELGRPVAVALSRQQVFEATMRRSETRQRLTLAADKDGRLLGIGHEALVSNLPGEAFSEPVQQATHFGYAAENRRIIHQIARLNRTCAGSVRAPGEAVGVPTFENALDELAEMAGIDPVELRLRNVPLVDPEGGIPFSSNMLAECLKDGARRFGWESRNRTPGARRDGEWLIGHGMASALRVNILAESRANVTLVPDGSAIVETDMTDIGTGTYAVLTQIAAEMLGLDPARVTTHLGDTRFPPAAGSGGSWGASSSGSSVFLACEDIRRQICERLGCEEAELTLKDGRAISANRSIPIGELLGLQSLSAEGHIQPGRNSKAVRQATYGAYFCEVAVSSVTGETRVRRIDGTFAAGRILNEKTARSQCIGGIVWGIGMALTEEIAHDLRDGHIVNRDLAEYHIPVNLDVPQIDVAFLDERDDWASPLQAKGLGELGICGAAGAVTNAIYNACGVRVRDYPATLDKILPRLG